MVATKALGDDFGALSLLFGIRRETNAKAGAGIGCFVFVLRRKDYERLSGQFPDDDEAVRPDPRRCSAPCFARMPSG